MKSKSYQNVVEVTPIVISQHIQNMHIFAYEEKKTTIS